MRYKTELPSQLTVRFYGAPHGTAQS
jgi:hypothetical protein